MNQMTEEKPRIDLAQFNALEIHGIIDGESGYDRPFAESFAVFGHLKTGGTNPISDHESFTEAHSYATQLAATCPMPVHIYC